MEKLEGMLTRMTLEFREVKTGIHSNVVDAVGCALAVQERKGSTSATASPPPYTELYLPHPSLLALVAEFFGKERAGFKTPQQAEALEMVISGTRHLLLVAATSAGKSLVWMLPARLIHPEKVTCVLLPLSSLHADFYRRCQEMRIQFSRWTPNLNTHPMTSIVFVSPEDAVTVKFVNYLIYLCNNHRLARLVLDEVHLILHQGNFRFCLGSLQPTISSSSEYRPTP